MNQQLLAAAVFDLEQRAAQRLRARDYTGATGLLDEAQKLRKSAKHLGMELTKSIGATMQAPEDVLGDPLLEFTGGNEAILAGALRLAELEDLLDAHWGQLYRGDHLLHVEPGGVEGGFVATFVRDRSRERYTRTLPGDGPLYPLYTSDKNEECTARAERVAAWLNDVDLEAACVLAEAYEDTRAALVAEGVKLGEADECVHKMHLAQENPLRYFGVVALRRAAISAGASREVARRFSERPHAIKTPETERALWNLALAHYGPDTSKPWRQITVGLVEHVDRVRSGFFSMEELDFLCKKRADHLFVRREKTPVGWSYMHRDRDGRPTHRHLVMRGSRVLLCWDEVAVEVFEESLVPQVPRRNLGQVGLDLLKTKPLGAEVLHKSLGGGRLGGGIFSDLFKGANHKYLLRVPTGKFTKTGKPKYRYVYKVSARRHGKGLTQAHAVHEKDLREGAAIRDHSEAGKHAGHWHLVNHDDKGLHLVHDETGDKRTFKDKAEALDFLRGPHHQVADEENARRQGVHARNAVAALKAAEERWRQFERDPGAKSLHLLRGQWERALDLGRRAGWKSLDLAKALGVDTRPPRDRRALWGEFAALQKSLREYFPFEDLTEIKLEDLLDPMLVRRALRFRALLRPVHQHPDALHLTTSMVRSMMSIDDLDDPIDALVSCCQMAGGEHITRESLPPIVIGGDDSQMLNRFESLKDVLVLRNEVRNDLKGDQFRVYRNVLNEQYPVQTRKILPELLASSSAQPGILARNARSTWTLALADEGASYNEDSPYRAVYEHLIQGNTFKNVVASKIFKSPRGRFFHLKGPARLIVKALEGERNKNAAEIVREHDRNWKRVSKVLDYWQVNTRIRIRDAANRAVIADVEKSLGRTLTVSERARIKKGSKASTNEMVQAAYKILTGKGAVGLLSGALERARMKQAAHDAQFEVLAQMTQERGKFSYDADTAHAKFRTVSKEQSEALYKSEAKRGRSRHKVRPIESTSGSAKRALDVVLPLINPAVLSHAHIEEVSGSSTIRAHCTQSNVIRMPPSHHVDYREWMVTLVHEFGHTLETGASGVLDASRTLQCQRSRGERPVSMRRFNPGYRDTERTYRDSWSDPYTGKYYPNATEIISMGLENLYCDPLKFANEDEVHFAHILATLAGDYGGATGDPHAEMIQSVDTMIAAQKKTAKKKRAK